VPDDQRHGEPAVRGAPDASQHGTGRDQAPVAGRPVTWRQVRLDAADRAEYGHTVAGVRAQLDETAFAVAWTKGRTMSLERAIEHALALAQSEAAAGAVSARATQKQPTRRRSSPLTPRQQEGSALIARGSRTGKSRRR
jgi:hypothetical protein